MQNETDNVCAAELLTADERLEIVDGQMEHLYKQFRGMQLLYPWVAVMLLKKEKTLESGLVLPEGQNKVMHEGIVLATWRDKLVDRGIIHRNGERVTRCEILHSELSAGDHVLFQHWAGQPIFDYDPQRFRLVRECDWHETKNGGIVAKVVYADRNQKAVTKMFDMLDTEDLVQYRKLTEAKINDHFIVVDREAEALLLSGR